MIKIRLFILLVVFTASCKMWGNDIPTINPSATFISDEGEEIGTAFSGSAPLLVKLSANAEHTAGWTAYYEWRFTTDADTSPYLLRYEENTEYTFTKSGTHKIELYAIFTQGTDTVAYTADYWNSADPISVTISESKLVMPNAFTPNGDGINDIYKAKDGYQSLIEFHAYIFNRWGQKLYDWTDPSQGWDGTYKGKPVKQGVYFVLVKAKGADGRKFNIRRDINLLRGYDETLEGGVTE